MTLNGTFWFEDIHRFDDRGKSSLRNSNMIFIY
jgi:hypothetical protein